MGIKKLDRNIIGALIAALGSLLIICVSLRVWEIDITVTDVINGGDGNLMLFFIKSIQQYGIKGNYMNYTVGAPGVSSLVDSPMVDPLMALLFYLLNLVTKNTVATFYLYNILSYLLVACAMYFLLMHFQIKWWINSIISILYAAAPYHFIRGFGHTALVNYSAVPLGVYLAYLVYKEDFAPFVSRRERNLGRGIGLFFIAAWIGSSYFYYAFFSALLIAVALLYKILQKKTFKPLIREGQLLVAVLGFVCIQLSPRVYYSLIHGKNAYVGQRVPYEIELYGMRIIQLLLPLSYSRIKWFRDIYNAYRESGVLATESMDSGLGLIASAALIGTLGWFVYSFIIKPKANDVQKKMDFLSLGTVVIVLWCIIGGIGTVFNYIVTPEVRSTNRGSIVVSCLVLTAAAVFLNSIESKKISAICCLAVMLIGLYDQVPVNQAGWQEEDKKVYTEYKQYFDQLEDSLYSGAMVYNLPYSEFPEAPPICNMGDYASFTGYFLTDNIRWSYGGVRGRNEEAKELNIDDGESIAFIDGLVDAGFAGVLIDTFGYENAQEDILAFYESFGLPKQISPDGRLYFFSLEGWENNPFKALVRDDPESMKLIAFVLSDLGYDAQDGLEQLSALVDKIRTGTPSALHSVWKLVENSEPVQTFTDEDYVKWAYKTVLGREADEGGLAGCLAGLENGGTREQIFSTLLTSEEFRDKYFLGPVQEEDPSIDGIYVFLAELCALGGVQNDADAMAELVWAIEAQDEQGLQAVWDLVANADAVQNLPDEKYVEWAYTTVLGREVDEDGLAEYTSALAQGMSRQQVFEILITSSEFRDKYNLVTPALSAA